MQSGSFFQTVALYKDAKWLTTILVGGRSQDQCAQNGNKPAPYWDANSSQAHMFTYTHSYTFRDDLVSLTHHPGGYWKAEENWKTQRKHKYVDMEMQTNVNLKLILLANRKVWTTRRSRRGSCPWPQSHKTPTCVGGDPVPNVTRVVLLIL